MTVVDASIAVKWFVHEAGSDAALTLLESPGLLIAPALARIEVHATLVKYYRLGAWELSDCQDACLKWESWLMNQTVRLVDDVELLSEARELACRWKHPLQDCLYLALAQQRQDYLVTADHKFFQKVQPESPWIRLLPAAQSH